MIGIAAGLAATGKIPFASSFAVFVPGRCFDQVRMSVAQPHLNVKLVTTHSGLSVGEDGSSHQAIEDLSLALSLPGFTVIVPADAIETAQAVRLRRGKLRAVSDSPLPSEDARRLRRKLPVQYRQSGNHAEGKDATIIAIGLMVPEALKAAETLKTGGIDCRVLNMSTLKPIDEAVIVRAAAETGLSSRRRST